MKRDSHDKGSTQYLACNDHIVMIPQHGTVLRRKRRKCASLNADDACEKGDQHIDADLDAELRTVLVSG